MDSLVLEDAASVAAAIKMTRRHVVLLARAGKLPCYRIGRKIRFHMPEVIASMKS